MPDIQEVPQIGKKAFEILATRTEGQVLGLTRHGIFLDFRGWVIYLSSEKFRGPLTISLNNRSEHLRSIGPGMVCSVAGQKVYFSSIDLLLDLTLAELWEAPVPVRHILDLKKRQASLYQLATGILRDDPLGGFHQALIPILKHPTSSGDTNLPPIVLETLGRLQQALALRRPDEIIDTLETFLGFGTGLTPSGDDLIAGMFLALKRWGDLLCPGLEIQPLVSTLLPSAYRKTTTLSANLIECAGNGQADERLLYALDGIITGEPGPDVCLEFLQSWGSSSGGNALVGMALVLEGGDSY